MKKKSREPPPPKKIIITTYVYSISSVKTSEIRIMGYALKGHLLHLKEERGD